MKTIFVYLLGFAFVFTNDCFAQAANMNPTVLSGDSPRITVEMDSSSKGSAYVTKIEGVPAFSDVSLDAALLIGSKFLAAYHVARRGTASVKSAISQADFGKTQISVLDKKRELFTILARPGQEKKLEEGFKKMIAQGAKQGDKSPLDECQLKLSKLNWLAKEGGDPRVSSLARKILEITSVVESGSEAGAYSAKQR